MFIENSGLKLITICLFFQEKSVKSFFLLVILLISSVFRDLFATVVLVPKKLMQTEPTDKITNEQKD